MLNFDHKVQEKMFTDNERKMENNPQQRSAYKTIIQRIYNPKAKGSNLIFLQASAGTGKTFVSNTLAANVRAHGDIALCCATSGIAANLFVNGRTMHSRFKIPLNCQKYSPLTIKRQSTTAELIRKTKLIIWDEAPMAHKNVLFWLDPQLSDIMDSNQPFGGKVLLLCGDFKQLPPVIPYGSPTAVISASIKSSHHFTTATILKLVRNERLRRELREQTILPSMKMKLQLFDAWMNDIGYDTIPKETDIHGAAIKINESNISHCKKLEEFVHETYHNMNETTNANYFKNRCILTPKNEDVRQINSICLKSFNCVSNERSLYKDKTYNSTDSVGLDDVSSWFTQEWLNTRQYNGVPLHQLRLKTGMPVILLRNINPAMGLCNGTRLIIKELHENILICYKMSDPETIFALHKMSLGPPPEQTGYTFKRMQFPIALAFGMTINKSQGQTLENTSIYLPQPVFEHGQLYVAISRVTSPDNLKIYMENAKDHGFIKNRWITKNVVYKPLLI